MTVYNEKVVYRWVGIYDRMKICNIFKYKQQ